MDPGAYFVELVEANQQEAQDQKQDHDDTDKDQYLKEPCAWQNGIHVEKIVKGNCRCQDKHGEDGPVYFA